MNKTIIILICYIIMAAIVPSLLIINKRTLKAMGACLLKLPRKSAIGVIVIDVIAILLPLLLFFRDYKNMNFLFTSCSIIAFFIMTKDGFNKKNYGVYQKGLIAPSAVFFYEDILGFPVFELPPEEQAHYAKNTLIVVTKKASRQEIIFSSDEECRAVVEKLKEIGVISV